MTAPALNQLDTVHPLTLLPVRLETRFRRGAVAGAPNAAGELLVRIYPDAILADSHEPLLTPNELAAGQDYWRRAFTDGRENDAWTALLGEALAPRAAWIVLQTTPSNVDKMAGGGASPQFPALTTRPEGWHAAPVAKLLPDVWVVSGYRGLGRVVQAVSAPVQAGLALTPRMVADDNAPPRVDLSGDGLTVEPDLVWAYDFGEAVKAGMAVRIPLSEADFTSGFSALVVSGVRSGPTPDQQSADLADLLTAHRFSRGLAFVAQGTRTNNTGDATSDYPVADPAGAVSFAIERAPAPTPADGGRFATALGLPVSTVEHLAGTGRDEQTAAQAMIDALWPATIGYFLDQLFAPEVSQDTVNAVRAWMRQWVRPRGPLPALRVGAVPYGVLPTVRFTVVPVIDPPGPPGPVPVGPVPVGPVPVGPVPVGHPPAGSARPVAAEPGATASEARPAALSTVDSLAALIRRYGGMARGLVAGAPHVGGTGDPDQDLVELLGMDASTATARVRRTLGYDAAWNVFGLTGNDMVHWQADQRQNAQTVLATIGETGRDPRAVYLSYAGRSDDFSGPMVAPLPLSETEPLTFDYVAWLATATPAQLRSQTAPPSDQPVTALLYLMLRHALLTEYDRTARRVLDLNGLLQAHEAAEPELIGVLPAQSTPVARTAWDRFDLQIPNLTGSLSLGQFLADDGGPGTPSDIAAALQELNDLRSALKTLSGLPTAELHRLFTETLDACSHRIDAWVTSLATSQLAGLRANNPTGTWSGCYGWAENLRADPPGDLVAVTLPDGSSANAHRDAAGFVVAPSMTHAAAAAVLRSAYLARSGPAQQPYTVDLSSQRVRRALGILDAIRDEQPLGSVLGAAFERGLHEGHPGVELDRFIDPLRRLYPAVAGKTETTALPADAVAARSIVDGLALLRAAQAGQVPIGTGDLVMTTDQRTAVQAELDAMAESVDSVSDLLLAESVFQMVKGSPSGSAATLDTLAKGQRPPEPEVVATPRGGTVLYHRIALVFGSGAAAPAWAGIAPTPRSNAAPEVDAWLAELIGDPATVQCSALPAGASAAVPVTLAQLALRPLDLLAAVQTPGELDARITRHLGAPSTVDYDTVVGSARSLGAVTELLAVTAELLGRGRPLTDADLGPPGQAAAATTASELDGRAAAAVQSLTAARAALAAAPTSPDAQAALAAFGLPGAFASGSGPDLLTTVDARLAAAAAAADAADRLLAVFGPGFPVVPRFTPTTIPGAEPALGDDPDSTVEGWLAQLGRVRPAVGSLIDARMLSRALGAAFDRPRIAQLPGDVPGWAGLPFRSEDQRPRSGLVSLALAGAAPPTAGQPWCGLLLDAWPEVIPSREEEAGLSFHYDAPGTQAPQAVLLAMPPTTGAWSFEHIERTLLDTLSLAQVRALDLSELGAYAQLLPMTFLAANPVNAAVSTSFQGLLIADAVVTTPVGG